MRGMSIGLGAAALLLAGATPGSSQSPAALADSLIRRALTTSTAGYISFQDDAQQWDEGRFFNFAKRSTGPDEPGARLLACLVRVEPRVQAPVCIAVPLLGLDPQATVDMIDVSDFDIDDLDQDGEPEATMEVRYTGALPRGFSGGETDEHTRLLVFDATPALHLALSEPIRLQSYTSRSRNLEAEVEFTDVNGDGHTDIVLSGRSCAPRTPGEGCQPLRRQLLWTRATDAWRAPRRASRAGSRI